MLQIRQNKCHPERLREGPCVFAVWQKSQPQGPSLQRKKRASVQDDSALGETDVH
jgi:hypothetical protein